MNSNSYSALELQKSLRYLASFAVSEAGQEACLALRPLHDFEVIAQKNIFYEQGSLWLGHTSFSITPFVPLGTFLDTLEKSRAALDMDGLWAIREVLKQAKAVYESITENSERNPWPALVERCHSICWPSKSISALNRCLGDDGNIRDEASPELALVRGEIRRLNQQCVRKVKDFAAEYNILHFLQDEFMTLSSDRYVLPLKVSYKNKLQGIVHDYSQTGETCYFEPMFLVNINNQLQELKREEREEERKIIAFLSALVQEERAGISSLYSLLVDIDILSAKVALSRCYDGRLVRFEDNQGVLLREARHPLLALAASPVACEAFYRFQLARQTSNSDFTEEASKAKLVQKSSTSAIASTLELKPEQSALVISGGNAGGKTVSLKTLGLVALMGMCSLPVPVLAGSFLPKWKHVHAFIGDEQNLEDHVSTFTAQISHLKKIWANLGSHSLVILDEFGAGTDPSQGAALAQAVIDSIMELGAFIVAATHFPALKAYAMSTKGVRAASVLFDPKTKKPLFRLVYDQVGASQALDVAREHGLPESVLAKAEQYLLLGGEDTSALIERLNTLAVEREEELNLLEKEKKLFVEKRKNLQERFAKEREILFSEVQKQAQLIMQEWKAGRVAHKQALKELSSLRGELANSAEVQHTENKEVLDLTGIAVGQKLRHLPWKRSGTVLEIDLRKNRIRLDLDGVSLWAAAGDLAVADTDKTVQKSRQLSQGVSITSTISLPLSLDLRGMRADVAISTLEKFLDTAILSGRREIEIIHGKGTGVLRREIHSFLAAYPAVASFNTANADRGGDGMTVVEMK